MHKICVFLIFLAFFLSISISQAATIVFVGQSGNDGDIEWREFLEAEGHTVITEGNWQELGDDEIATMNSADLVIIGSNAGQSGNLATDQDEIDGWNSVEVPMINLYTLTAAANRWNWISTSNNAYTYTVSTIIVDDPTNFLLSGVTIDAGNEATIYTDSAIFGTVSSDVGNGTLIAHTSGASSIPFAIWEAGVETYDGSGVIPPAMRMTFPAGVYGGAFNLNDNGKIMFLNALGYMLDTGVGPATKPNPKNGAKGVTISDTTLSWTPGPFAYTHDVFFGTDFNDVNESTVDALKGNTVVSADQEVDANTYDPGKLEYGKTYYWRVDEANEPPDDTVFTGKVWSFTTESEGIELTVDNIKDVVAADVTPLNAAQDPNTTCDGTGLTVDEVNDISTHDNDYNTMWAAMGSVPGDVWLSYELDQIYKLHELKIWNYNEAEPYKLFGAKDVNILYSIDNETWMALDELQVLNIAPGTNKYSNYDVVDMNGAVAKYVKLVFMTSYGGEGLSAGGISEIIFSVIPTRVSEPNPEDQADEVPLDAMFKWKAGRGVGIHKIYIGSDYDSVKEGNADIIDETEDSEYEITLDLAKTYYWKVDEVNEAEDYPVWDGPVWKFSTQQYVIVDDFEVGYEDNDTNAVYLTWLDGESYGDDNGSWMGRDEEPYLQTISRNGDYSAPMQYENDYYSYSEVRAETSKLAQIGSDWSKGSPNTLEIWFRADSNDVNEPVADILYAIINDGDKIYYDGETSDIRKPVWSKFEVPLDGINLSNVTSLAIGVEPIDSSEGGDVGTLYFDDIRLAVSVESVNPTDANLILWYEMEDNVLDSSNSGFDGDPNNGNLGNGGLTYEEGKYGKALVFDGNDDYVSLPIGQKISTLTSCTISTWVNYAGGDGWQKVFDFGKDTNIYMDLSADNTSGNIRCSITTQSYQNEDGINAPSILAEGYWEHIVVVFDKEDGTLKLYRNGDLAGIDDEVTTYPEDLGETDKNWLGRSVWEDNPFFNGKIDDFRIYDRALSAGEVKYLFKN